VLAISTRLNSRGFYAVELLDEERCTSCAACALVCPDVVITVYRPERVRVG
jgi:2-oxoglutarate ferredoxin oxidoreductase subunit delta